MGQKGGAESEQAGRLLARGKCPQTALCLRIVGFFGTVCYFSFCISSFRLSFSWRFFSFFGLGVKCKEENSWKSVIESIYPFFSLFSFFFLPVLVLECCWVADKF